MSIIYLFRVYFYYLLSLAVENPQSEDGEQKSKSKPISAYRRSKEA